LDKSPGDSLLFKQSALRGVSYALTEQLLNGNSNIAQALREIGVSFHVTGVGRGSKSYLVKAA